MSKVSSSTVALVTGANRGIGRAIVDALLDRGVAKVYAGARDPKALDGLVAQARGRVVALELDVTRPEQVAAAAQRATDVTLLVNNAGVATGFGAPITDPAILADGRTEWAVNVEGTLRVTQAFAPILAKNGGGAVVNIGSVASLANFPAFITYSISKAALHSLTQATRATLAAQGTTVHGVYPGPVDTDMGKVLPIDKVSPRSVADEILDGVAQGAEEIFPDPVAKQLGGLYLASPKQVEQAVAAMAAA